MDHDSFFREMARIAKRAEKDLILFSELLQESECDQMIHDRLMQKLADKRLSHLKQFI